MTTANLADEAYRIYTEPRERELQRPTSLARGTLPPIVSFEPVAPSPEHAVSDATERALIAILTADRVGSETIELAYKRKECELAVTFSRLSPGAARALHLRLLAARTDDLLASCFARLIESRRIRLLALLVAARR